MSVKVGTVARRTDAIDPPVGGEAGLGSSWETPLPSLGLVCLPLPTFECQGWCTPWWFAFGICFSCVCFTIPDAVPFITNNPIIPDTGMLFTLSKNSEDVPMNAEMAQNHFLLSLGQLVRVIITYRCFKSNPTSVIEENQCSLLLCHSVWNNHGYHGNRSDPDSQSSKPNHWKISSFKN